MSLSSGPNSATLGLVFAYDTGDRTNSYIGQPTTNIWDGVQYSIYNQDATNYRNQTFPLPPVPGYEVVKVVTNTPGSYGHSILWKAPYPNNNVATITNSIYAWMESGTYVQVGQHWYPWYYGTQKNIPKSQWVRISETYTINEGSSYSVAALTYSTDGTAYFAMPQYEYTSFPSPFLPANGTRSVTQGLLPLTGSTINLTDVSFNNSGQITFDGTNDKISLDPILASGASQYTIEAVFKANSTKTQVIWEQNSSTVIQNKRACMILLSNGYGGFNGQSNDYHSAVPYSTGVWYHWVIVVDRSGATNPIKIYVNGSLYAQGEPSNGAGNLDVGNYASAVGYKLNASDEYFEGQIPVVRVYNRAINANEVQDNYKGYKTRFNLG